MNKKYTEDRADIIENLIIKLGDAGDKDLMALLDSYEEEIEELKNKINKISKN